jgi:DNA (cytosine-5)-methyltransferase 1
MDKNIILLDLFSGIGGFSAGLTDAGFNITKHYFSEIDKHAIAVYKYQFKNSEYVGSVTTLDGRAITRPNIITFGSPCQDFSVAGKRAGMEGQRSSLIGEALRLIAECRPDVFIWENVKGVFSSNSGADFWAIIQAFTNIGGYRLEWQLLNTAWFLPQNRERIYLIGHLTEAGRDWKRVFPIGQNDYLLKTSTSVNSPNSVIAPCLQADYYKTPTDGQYLQVGDYRSDEGIRIREDGNCPTLQARERTDIYGQPVVMVGDYRSDDGFEIGHFDILEDNSQRPSRWQRSEKGKQARRDSVKQGIDKTPFSNGNRELKPTENNNIGCITGATNKDSLVFMGGLNEHNRGDGRLSRDYKQQNRVYDAEKSREAATLASTMNSKYLNNSSIRRLTEIECEFLQGFPKNWTEYGDYDGVIKKVAKTQRYKCLGNAVTCRVVEEIGKRLLKSSLTANYTLSK